MGDSSLGYFLCKLFFRGKIAFGIQRGHTPCSRSRDRLTVHVIGGITGYKNARYIRFGCAGSVNDIPCFIQCNVVLKNFGIGLMSNGHEETSRWNFKFLIRCFVSRR